MNHFTLEKETIAIKARILRYVQNLFEHEEEEDYCKPVRVVIFGVTIFLNTKVTVIKIKYHQLKNIVINLDHTKKA